MYLNNSINDLILQDDFYGHRSPWRAKKVANEYLSMAYAQIDPKKAQRLSECSTQLLFRKYDTGEMKLHSMNSCRVRLCPLCTWRRTLRVYADNKKIFRHVDPDNSKYKYILLTLTEKNCTGENLSKRIDALFYAWKLFAKTKPFKQAVKGWYRGLEVTHNTDFLSKDYNTYHPHFHVILVVNKSYFTSRYYLSQAQWGEMWKNALKANYDPVVDVRKINNVNDSKTIAEISKYPVKDADFVIYDDWELTTETVSILDEALNNRRLIAYGGILKDAKKELKISDIESADLVHTDDEAPTMDDNFKLEFYFWHTGYRQYLKGEN